MARARSSSEKGVRSFAKMTDAEPDTIIIAGVGRGDELEAVAELWPAARVIGCEPLREHLELLADRWPFDPADLLPVALSNVSGEASLHCNYEPDQRATLYPLPDLKNPKVRECQLMTLDDLAAKTGPWVGDVMLWLDAEGSETNIIDGAETSLDAVRWANLEVSTMPMREFPVLGDVISTMDERGFRLAGFHTWDASGLQADAVFVRSPDWESLRRSRLTSAIARKVARRSHARARAKRRRSKGNSHA